VAILLGFPIGRGHPLLDHNTIAIFLVLSVSFECAYCDVAKILDLFELGECRVALNQPFMSAHVLFDMFDGGGKVSPRGFE
jgi:hypothetical protein